MSYKRLGDYIQLVDNRNKDLKVTNLLGINITKSFMPSVANVSGTDLSKYKVIRKGQFARRPRLWQAGKIRGFSNSSSR